MSRSLAAILPACPPWVKRDIAEVKLVGAVVPGPRSLLLLGLAGGLCAWHLRSQQRHSPIGYLADPQAYVAGEYAATTVPRILGLPPFKPEAASVLSRDCGRLLTQLAAG